MRQWIDLVENIQSYRQGMCDAMALALHQRYGYQIAVWRGFFPDDLGDEGEEAFEDCHMCVLLPNGDWADVDGIHSGQPSNLHFDAPVTRVELTPITPDEAREVFTTVGVSDDEIARAQQFAPILEAFAPEIKWAVPRDSDELYRTVWIDTDRLYRGWERDPMFVGGPDHRNAIKGRIPRFDQWMRDEGLTTPVIMPDVSISNGNVSFGNGRHRFTWMREHGVRVMPVRVPVEYADEMQERFGVNASEAGTLHDPRPR